MKILQLPSNNFLVFSLFFFLTGCSLFSNRSLSRKEQFLAHQKEWQEFRLKGIIEFQYKEFAFRKNISIKKNKEILRIDVFDSGLFGLSPKPLFTAFWDSVFTISTNDLITLSDQKIKVPPLKEAFDLISYQEVILKKESFSHKRTTFYFSQNMRLEKIDFSEQISAEFSYNEQLKDITIKKNNTTLAQIMVDEISFKNVKITR